MSQFDTAMMERLRLARDRKRDGNCETPDLIRRVPPRVQRGLRITARLQHGERPHKPRSRVPVFLEGRR